MFCPKCEGNAFQTDYRPPDGIDPTQREYECQSCGYTWYQCIYRYPLSKAVQSELIPRNQG